MTDDEMAEQCREVMDEITDAFVEQILLSSEEDKDEFKRQLADDDRLKKFLDGMKKEIIRDIGNTVDRSLADI